MAQNQVSAGQNMAALSEDVARLKHFPKKEMILAEYNSILGGLDSDTIFGSSGNDLITGGGGDDYLDGGLGVDTVLYSGDQKSYILAFSKRSTGIEDRRGIDGTDFRSLRDLCGLMVRDASAGIPYVVVGT